MRFDSNLLTVNALLASLLAVGCIDVTCAERGTCPPASSTDDASTPTEEPRPSTDTERGTSGSNTDNSSMSELDASSSGAQSSDESGSSGSRDVPSSAECGDAGCMCTSDGCIDAGQPCDAEQVAACATSGDVCWLNEGVGTCVECALDADCSEASPACVAHACEVCDLATHRGCSEAAPYCVAGDAPPLGDTAASGATALDGSAPLTNLDAAASLDASSDAARTCVACRNFADCGRDAPICRSGACIECETNADCTDASASQCDLATNSCVPCNAVGQCAHLAGTPACNVGAGTCVECTAAERSICGNKACTTVPGETQFTCSEQGLGNVASCGSCVSDAACQTGHGCVLETFEGEATEWVCLQRMGTGPGEVAACTSNVQLTAEVVATSVDQVSDTFCRPRRTTCGGYRSYGTGGGGIDGWCSSHEDCGLTGFNDGQCLPVGNDPDFRLCTHGCQFNVDCPNEVQCAQVNGSGGRQICALD